MKLIQTKRQVNTQHLPTQLEFLEIIAHRGSEHFKEQKQLYKSRQAGDTGERKLINYLATFGSPHWQVVRNLWLKTFNLFECDLVLITRHCIYIFEVKHYRGTFAYKNGKCFFNGTESPLNPFEQVRANAASVRNYLKQCQIKLPVKAAVIFTGEDNEVFVHSEIEEIEVVPSNGLRNFILELVAEENQSPHHSQTPNFLMQTLEQIETTNPFQPEPLSTHALREIKPGIYCANCKSFKLLRQKLKIRCQCGLEESLEEAVIRTICEYGVLHLTNKVRRKELHQFMNQEVSLSYIQKILRDHFTRIDPSISSDYEIKSRLYENIQKDFTIKEARTFYHQNGERTVYRPLDTP